MKKTILGVGASLVLFSAALAADNATVSSNPQPPQGTDNISGIRQQLQDQLTKAGYSDVKIVPSSFFVEAKDKNGNPVQMVISPDSITAVAYVTPNTRQ
jgi:hypothetical protein